jgi:hypothetical protein
VLAFAGCPIGDARWCAQPACAGRQQAPRLRTRLQGHRAQLPMPPAGLALFDLRACPRRARAAAGRRAARAAGVARSPASPGRRSPARSALGLPSECDCSPASPRDRRAAPRPPGSDRRIDQPAPLPRRPISACSAVLAISRAPGWRGPRAAAPRARPAARRGPRDPAAAARPGARRSWLGAGGPRPITPGAHGPRRLRRCSAWGRRSRPHLARLARTRPVQELRQHVQRLAEGQVALAVGPQRQPRQAQVRAAQPQAQRQPQARPHRQPQARPQRQPPRQRQAARRQAAAR